MSLLPTPTLSFVFYCQASLIKMIKMSQEYVEKSYKNLKALFKNFPTFILLFCLFFQTDNVSHIYSIFTGDLNMLFQILVYLVLVYPSEINKHCFINNKTEAHKGLVTYSGREVPVRAMKSNFPYFRYSILIRTALLLSASNKKQKTGLF